MMINEFEIRKRRNLRDEEDIMKVPQSLFRADILSKVDEEDLCWFLSSYPTLLPPAHISSHQVRCVVMRERKDYIPETITDFLRFGIYMIGGNQDLPKIKKWRIVVGQGGRKKKEPNPEYRNFRNIPRSERKEILGRLERSLQQRDLTNDDVLGEIKSFQPQWKVFMDRYHPRDFKKMFPNVWKLYAIISDRSFLKPVATWNSCLQKKYDSGEKIPEIAGFCSTRPKEFLYSLHSFLGKCGSVVEEDEVINHIWELKDVSTSDLITTIEHFDALSSGCTIDFDNSKIRSKYHVDLAIMNATKESLMWRLMKNIKDQVGGMKDLEGKKVYISRDLKNVPVGKFYNVSTEKIPPVIPNRATIYLTESDSVVAFLVSSDFSRIRSLRGREDGHVSQNMYVVRTDCTGWKQKNGMDYLVVVAKKRNNRRMELGYSPAEPLKHGIYRYRIPTPTTSTTLKRFTVPSDSPGLGVIIDLSDGSGKTFELGQDGEEIFIHGRSLDSYDLLKMYVLERGGTLVDESKESDIDLGIDDVLKYIEHGKNV